MNFPAASLLFSRFKGSYDLIRDEDKDEVHACRGEQYYVLYDRPVRVEVVSAPEEDGGEWVSG